MAMYIIGFLEDNEEGREYIGYRRAFLVIRYILWFYNI